MILKMHRHSCWRLGICLIISKRALHWKGRKMGVSGNWLEWRISLKWFNKFNASYMCPRSLSNKQKRIRNGTRKSKGKWSSITKSCSPIWRTPRIKRNRTQPVKEMARNRLFSISPLRKQSLLHHFCLKWSSPSKKNRLWQLTKQRLQQEQQRQLQLKSLKMINSNWIRLKPLVLIKSARFARNYPTS